MNRHTEWTRVTVKIKNKANKSLKFSYSKNCKKKKICTNFFNVIHKKELRKTYLYDDVELFLFSKFYNELDQTPDSRKIKRPTKCSFQISSAI